MNPVAVIRHQVHGTDESDLGDCLYVWCPGCDGLHAPCVRMGVKDRPVWTFNGSLEAPGVEPSILVIYGADKASARCHSFLRDGRWSFLMDCTHELAGKTVDMVPLPDWVVRDAA